MNLYSHLFLFLKFYYLLICVHVCAYVLVESIFFSFKFSIVGEREGLCQGGLNLKITHILEEGKLRDD